MGKWLIVERNGQQFGTCGHGNWICRVLFIYDSLSSIWGHSVHFAIFPILRFSKGCEQSPPVFIQFQGYYSKPGYYFFWRSAINFNQRPMDLDSLFDNTDTVSTLYDKQIYQITPKITLNASRSKSPHLWRWWVPKSQPVKQINAKFGGKVPFHHISRPFLALLVYTARGYSILNWAPVFGGICSVAVLRNCEVNKCQMLWRGSYMCIHRISGRFFRFFSKFWKSRILTIF